MQNSGFKNIAIIIGLVAVVGIGYFLYDNKTTNKTTTNLPAPTTNATSTANTAFTMAEVTTHNGRASCYTTISGSVYDLTAWIDKHPGGPDKILSLCGTDGTAAFTGQHGGQRRPEQELASFKIGVLTQ